MKIKKTKSQMVQDFLKQNPEITNKQVFEKMIEAGNKCSVPLIAQQRSKLKQENWYANLPSVMVQKSVQPKNEVLSQLIAVKELASKVGGYASLRHLVDTMELLSK